MTATGLQPIQEDDLDGCEAGTQTETLPKTRPRLTAPTCKAKHPFAHKQSRPPRLAWELIVTATPPADAARPVPGNDIPDDRIRCDACPVMCVIRPGQAGACDRYANQGGALVRVDPNLILRRRVAGNGRVVRFGAAEWDGTVVG